MSNKVTLKSKIIPSSWKKNIDEIIERELVEANRYFAVANPRLSELIEEVSALPPQSFYQELLSRWNWHNHFYEKLLEPAIPLLLEPSVHNLTPAQIALLRTTYRISSLVDQATLVVSAAIKKHVGLWMEILPECQKLSPEDIRVLMTSPRESYPVRYLIDHLSYLIATKEDGNSEQMRQNLMSRYHANDEDIFTGRLKQLVPLPCLDVAHLRQARGELEYEAYRQVRSFYLTVGRPRLQVIQNILDYDNNEEKRIVRELIGISGFVLRKEVIRYLREAKILHGEKGIYEYQDEVIDSALAALSNYQEEKLDRQVVPYQQHGLTCTAACLTMVATHFGLGKLHSSFEQEIAEASKSRLIVGQHFSGVAVKAISLGLEVVLLHSSPHLFDNSKGWLPQDLFRQLVTEYEGYLSKISQDRLMRVENGRPLLASDLQNYLKQGYLVIVAGITEGEMLHAILLTGYTPRGYISIDPIYGKQRINSVNVLDTFMETKVGRWAMLLRPDQAPIERLRSEVVRLENKALTYLA